MGTRIQPVVDRRGPTDKPLRAAVCAVSAARLGRTFGVGARPLGVGRADSPAAHMRDAPCSSYVPLKGEARMRTTQETNEAANGLWVF